MPGLRISIYDDLYVSEWGLMAAVGIHCWWTSEPMPAQTQQRVCKTWFLAPSHMGGQ